MQKKQPSAALYRVPRGCFFYIECPDALGRNQSFNLFQISSWNLQGFDSVNLIPEQNLILTNLGDFGEIHVATAADAVERRVCDEFGDLFRGESLFYAVISAVEAY